jgi:hypothetical protein
MKLSATLEIPASGAIGPSRTEGLPDELALVMGLTAAWSLSEDDGDVIVTLSDGDTRVISPNTLRGKLSIGRLGKGR